MTEVAAASPPSLQTPDGVDAVATFTLQQFGDFLRECAVVVDADELEIGLVDGLVIAAEAVIVSAIG